MGLTVMDEQQPLLGRADGSEQQDCLERGERQHEAQAASSWTWKEWTAEKLEAPSTHKAVILLIAIDACCVLADLSYTFLSPERDCALPATGASYAYALSKIPVSDLGLSFLHTLEEHQPVWLAILAHISLAITTLFLLEIPLALWCFGLNYYNPLPKSSQGSRIENENPYAALHLFDAFVVLTTFVLEVVLRGREAELAGLLVLLRLWRLVKLVGGIAKGAGELQEELSNKLEETECLLQEERARAQKLEEENAQLRTRLSDAGASMDDT